MDGAQVALASLGPQAWSGRASALVGQTRCIRLWNRLLKHRRETFLEPRFFSSRAPGATSWNGLQRAQSGIGAVLASPKNKVAPRGSNRVPEILGQKQPTSGRGENRFMPYVSCTAGFGRGSTWMTSSGSKFGFSGQVLPRPIIVLPIR